jgi:hypothetical protein
MGKKRQQDDVICVMYIHLHDIKEIETSGMKCSDVTMIKHR